jgi:NADH-quinone oxidoreductase subunit I
MSMALLKGLALTLRYFFRRPITLQYPEQKQPVPARFRGRPELKFNPGGMPVCVACGLCERVCPSQCITVVPETGKEGIRALSDYTLDLNRCSFCGLCVEACPVEAIRMSHEYELAARSRRGLVYKAGMLKVGPAWGSPQAQEGD